MASFTKDEMLEALDDIRREYPAVFKWFFLYQVEKNREKNAALCNETTSGEASRTAG